MEKIYISKLMSNLIYIKDNITLPQLSRTIDIMIEKGHIYMDEKDSIMSKKSVDECCDWFIRIICKRGGSSFADLLHAFRITGNSHVANMLKGTAIELSISPITSGYQRAQKTTERNIDEASDQKAKLKMRSDQTENQSECSTGTVSLDSKDSTVGRYRSLRNEEAVDNEKESLTKCLLLEKELVQHREELEKLQQVEDMNFYLENQVDNLEDDIKQLKQTIADKEKEIMRLKNKLGKIQTHQEVIRKEGAETRQKLDGVGKHLNQKLDGVDERLDGFDKQITSKFDNVDKQLKLMMEEFRKVRITSNKSNTKNKNKVKTKEINIEK